MNLIPLAFVLGLYFVPTIIAHHRGVTNLGSIAVINIFLGWTFVGWVVALAMAFRSAPPREETSFTKLRTCPHCNRTMKRTGRVCPHCEGESEPMIFHTGFWWAKAKNGEWQWFDETPNIWRWYRDGTPSSPSATDLTPSHAARPCGRLPSGNRKAPRDLPRSRSVRAEHERAELERLADLHARGVLNDEEFQQAKQQVLRQ